MFKDKYLSIFSHQMRAIVFIILQIFFATPALSKIGDSPVLAGEYSVMRLLSRRFHSGTKEINSV